MVGAGRSGYHSAMTRTAQATLAGGCFWCLDAVYRRLEGVGEVVSGYTGGEPANPSYELVCTGTTGHAEAVQITYDPDVLSYRELLEVFFTIHDPTQLNRQGADTGTQYRSAVFWHDEEQKADAERMIAELEREEVFDDPIVTTLERFDAWYPAEGYHQDYFAKNPGQPYCAAVVGPKVARFRQRWVSKLKAAAT